MKIGLISYFQIVIPFERGVIEVMIAEIGIVHVLVIQTLEGEVVSQRF